MGIRINKVLGYGLTNVKTKGEYNEILDDSRINPHGFFAMRAEDKEENFSDEGFDAYLDAHAEDPDDVMNDLSVLRHLRERERLDKPHNYRTGIFHRLIYDSEFGMPNVMVFQPPVFGSEWSRYDDMIDYYDPQQQADNGGCGMGYTMIDRALYPFESFCDHRHNPPTVLKGNDWHWYIDAKNSPRMVEYALKELGFATEEEMHAQINPMIPNELIALLRYCKVFTKDEYIYQLRPMIYWYWS